MNRMIVFLLIAALSPIHGEMTIDGGKNVKDAIEISSGKYQAKLTRGQADYYKFEIREDRTKVSISVIPKDRGKLQLHLARAGSKKIRLIAKGEKERRGAKIDAKPLPRGRYFVRVHGKAGEYDLELQFEENSPQEFEFRFRPPHGVVCKQTHVVISSDGGGGAQSTTRKKITFKRTEEGYLVEHEILSQSMERNGRKMEHPMFKLIEGVTLTYKHDEQGQIQDITGYEEMLKKVETVIGSEKVQTFRSQQKLQKQREMANWKAEIGALIGKKGKVGDIAQITVGERRIKNLRIPQYIVEKYTKQVRHKGRNCIQIDTFAHSDLGKLQQLVEIPKDRLPQKRQSYDNLEMVGRGVMIVEPETLLVHLVQHKETITATWQGQTAKIQHQEKIENEYR